MLKDVPPLKITILRLFGLLLVLFPIWWFLLEPALLPVLAICIEMLINSLLGSIEISIVYEEGNRWIMHSNILWGDGSNPGRTTSLQFTRLGSPLTVLPLSLCLVFAAPGPFINRLGITLLAAGFISLLLLWTGQSIEVLAAAGADYRTVSTTGEFDDHRNGFVTWLPNIKAMHGIVGQLLVFGMPPLLSYFLNISWWKTCVNQPDKGL